MRDDQVLASLVTGVISDEVTLDELFQSVADTARSLIGAHQASCGLVDHEGTRLVNASSLSEKYAQWTSFDAPADGSGINGWAREQNRPLRLTHDELIAHPRWRGFGEHADRHPPMNGWLVAPLTSPNGDNIGLLQLSDRIDGEFDDEDLQTAVLLAAIASAALEHRRLLDVARADRSRLRAMNDALPGGVAVRGRDGSVLYANQWVKDHLQIASTVRDGAPGPSGDPYELIDESGRPLTRDEYPTIRAGRGEQFHGDVVGLVEPDGVRWLLTSGRTIVDDQGTELGGLVVIIDSTDEIENRRRLLRSEQLLSGAERIAGIGSWSFRAGAPGVHCSAALVRMLRLDTDRPSEDALVAAFHPDDRQRLTDGMAATFDDGVPFTARLRLAPEGPRRADDREPQVTERVVEVVAERFDEGEGRERRTGLLGTVRDLTSEIAAQERLERADRMDMVGRLAGGLAHDFNNLLTVLIGHSELLRQNASDEQLGHLDAITAATERAADLTRQLLEFGRRDILQPRPIDVNALVGHLERFSRSVIPSGVDLAVRPSSTPPVAFIDPSKIEQVVLNLLLNARDAVGEHGSIVVDTAVVDVDDDPELDPGAYVRIRVTDDGPGMPGHVLDRALEPFFTTKSMGNGTGLGLATSCGIVAQSGGLLRLHSLPGSGTTATVLLPHTVEPAETWGRGEAPDGSASPPITILLVEDEEHVRGLLERFLTKLGHRVLAASDGADAVAVASGCGERIDLLLTDVSMPGLNGHEVAEALTASRPELRVLFMSGYTENSVVTNGMARGDIDLIPKPFTMATLRQRIDAVARSITMTD